MMRSSIELKLNTKKAGWWRGKSKKYLLNVCKSSLKITKKKKQRSPTTWLNKTSMDGAVHCETFNIINNIIIVYSLLHFFQSWNSICKIMQTLLMKLS